jgi:hypothetical protein
MNLDEKNNHNGWMDDSQSCCGNFARVRRRLVCVQLLTFSSFVCPSEQRFRLDYIHKCRNDKAKVTTVLLEL